MGKIKPEKMIKDYWMNDFVISSIDYCNSLLSNTSLLALNRLQRVLNMTSLWRRWTAAALHRRLSLFRAKHHRWVAQTLLCMNLYERRSFWAFIVTIGAIKIKSGIYDYVGEGNPHAKFGNSEITGGFSPHGWKITFQCSSNNFFNVMLIFEQSYRWDCWTDFNVQYLITRVSLSVKTMVCVCCFAYLVFSAVNIKQVLLC